MTTAIAPPAPLVVGDLGPADHAEAVEVLARGMRDNPIHVAVLGPDPARRVRLLRRQFASMFRLFPDNEPICVRRDGAIVAVTGVLLRGACRPSPAVALRTAPVMAALGPRTTVRTVRWLAAWGAQHPHDPHAHLGPLAVDAHLQGQGIGSVLLAEHTRRLDAAGVVGYLETDKRENVRFYERAGFVVIAEAEVLGLPNWFMRREPRAAAS